MTLTPDQLALASAAMQADTHQSAYTGETDFPRMFQAGYAAAFPEPVVTDENFEATFAVFMDAARTVPEGNHEIVAARAGLKAVLSALRPSPVAVSDEPHQHIGWLRQYLAGMTDDNWEDMKLRAERQLDRLAASPVAVSAEDGNRPIRMSRDELGRRVREAWVRWAETQPAPKPSWLVPYDELSEPDKEADRQIGEAVARWALIADAAWAGSPVAVSAEEDAPLSTPQPASGEGECNT